MVNKKSIIGPVISVFTMVLVISILAGLTFLFVSQLKTNVETTTLVSATIYNETGATVGLDVNYTLAAVATSTQFQNPVILAYRNDTIGDVAVANFSVSADGILRNASAEQWKGNVTYSYSHIGDTGAYLATNDTEAAGASIVAYLPLIFLAIIFGAILTLVLKIILPYINLGKNMGGF